MDQAVEVRDAIVEYGGSSALDGLTLSIGQGELLGVFGSNGAGKTTLLRLLEGLVMLSSGSASIMGRELSSANLRWIRTSTAYVPQAFRIDPRMPVSARDVVLMGRYGRIGLLRRPGPADMQAVKQALEQVDASHLAPRPFGQLSGGEQQRVAIARALAQDPQLLLLDEPTNSLDWDSQLRVCDLVRTVHNERGLTSVVVSHDVEFLARLCDRIVLMEGGRIIGERDPESFAHCCQRHPHPTIPSGKELPI